MTEPAGNRRDPARPSRRRGDIAAWVGRHAEALAWLVPIMFVIFGALAVGIAFTSNTAKRALDLNEKSSAQRDRLSRQVAALTRQNKTLTEQSRELIDSNQRLAAEVAALRRQVEELGGEPVLVTVEDNRSDPPPTTTTTQPAPTTTMPCRVMIAGRCRDP